MTVALKAVIADIVESILFALNYPIARSGVVISIGPYQLQVADACSGLHSMFSLSALGTLFMYIRGRKGKLHNGIMLVSILPIAFVANIIRVMSLVLITFYWGDEAGQGFLHGAAGILLMFVALCSLFMLDALLSIWLRPAAPHDAHHGNGVMTTLRLSIVLTILMTIATGWRVRRAPDGEVRPQCAPIQT